MQNSRQNQKSWREKDQCRLRCGLIWVDILLTELAFHSTCYLYMGYLVRVSLARVRSPTPLGHRDYIQQTMPQPFKKNLPKYPCDY